MFATFSVTTLVIAIVLLIYFRKSASKAADATGKVIDSVSNFVEIGVAPSLDASAIALNNIVKANVIESIAESTQKANDAKAKLDSLYTSGYQKIDTVFQSVIS